MTQALKRKLTYDDLLGMPDDGLRRETLDGAMAAHAEGATRLEHFDWPGLTIDLDELWR